MKRFTQSILWGFRDTMSDVTLKVVRPIGLFLVVATLTVGSDLAYPDHKTNHKPGKGGQLTTNLMSVLFSNPSGAITDDGRGAYIDERAGGDQGVEAFLFGSGNLALRTDGSSRQLTLDFGTGPVYVTVREFYNVGLHLSDLERDCDNAGHKAGPIDLNDRGLLCMIPGASRASGFAIWWDDTVDPNRRFKLDFRYDYDDSTDNVLITRCSADPNVNAVNAARCNELVIADDLTWIFSTTVNYDLHTGPTARLHSDTIKGKRNSVDYDLFDMPFEFIATCVQNCP